MSDLPTALQGVHAGVDRVIGECKPWYVMVDGKLTMHHTARVKNSATDSSYSMRYRSN